ncbi:hypothetical protein H4582DRAFT_1101693 [Lactarius indigo]|nr:hypothetical protein H4582DRAFT_1101693 [Lactarius indigo]
MYLTTCTALIRRPPKASAFLLYHQIQPPLVQYWTLSSHVQQPSTPLPELRPPSFLLPLPSAVALRHNANPLTPSDAPNLPSSAPYNPVLDNKLPTVPEPYSSIVATTAPGASPVPTFAPDMDAAAKDDDGSQPGLHKEKDALEVNRGIHANSTDNLEPPRRSPPLRSVNEPEGIAIAGPSLQEPNAEHTGDHPSHTSHGRYDMV